VLAPRDCADLARARAVHRRASVRVREAHGLTCAYAGKTLKSTADELQETREEKASLHERVAEARRALTVSRYAPAPSRVRAGARKAILKHFSILPHMFQY